MVKRILAILATVVFALCAFSLPALALDKPDSTVIDYTHAYQHILETGDMGFLIGYHVNYTSTPLPTEPASSTIIIRLLDGVTELGNTQPYAYYNRGYGGGIAWLYFSAAQVTAKSMSWGVNGATVLTYTTGLIGNPFLTWTGGAPSITSPITSASSTTTIAATKLEIASEVLATGLRLGGEWSAQLVVNKGIGQYLSDQATSTIANGESYFPYAIPNLRNIAPSVFLSQSTAVVYPTVEAGHIAQLYHGAFTHGALLDIVSAQTILPTASINVTSITILAHRVNNPGNIVCVIYPTIGGYPDVAGASLGYSGLLNGNTWTTNTAGVYYTFNFTTPIVLSPGILYGFLIGAGANDNANYIVLHGDTNRYPYGNAMSYDYGTTTWTDYLGNDFYFDIVPTIGVYKQSVENQLIGTPFDVTAAANALGVSRMVLSSFIILVAIVLFIVTAARSNPNASRYSSLIAIIGIIFGTAIGGVSMIWVGIVGLAAVFLIAYVLGLEKAGV